MKYFFLAYALIAILVVSIGGFRGDKFAHTPIEVFPDMDRQDVVKAQNESFFFEDGLGARQPVEGTLPYGFDTDGESTGESLFSTGDNYFSTGAIDEFYANGMPSELELNDDNIRAFLLEGKEGFEINCTICHGEAGNGQGMAAKYGVPAVANLRAENFFQDVYPDGKLYHVITHGKGQMGAYKHNLTLRERWAVVAYVRALQLASAAPLSDPAIKAAFEEASAAQ